MVERILMNEYKALSQEPWVNIEIDEQNILNWNLGLIVLNPDSLYYGGYFKASMKFPSNYPYSPPEFRFLRPLYHPNIYKDGRLCISILHAPGEDEMSGELASERWSPAQRVESVLISILSLLDDAEISSPANVDASVMLRKNPEHYKSTVRQNVEDSKKDIPEGFVMPTHHTTSATRAIEKDDSDFWAESDVDDDVFGGSDSDEDLDVDDDQETGSEEEDEQA
ncbi:putative ubiquitin conjugating enzyme (UbcC) [Aspergillus homomorphus CBS 101889]|uniref:Ubiquitin-conjugating enzyme E2 2 n=1 Tax=Aspergillus homomorphus (strain CBS 101889) TaxID=1450537 RepID=A0A395HXR9_ASPHC|nr:ubiquitin-protein ligase [Aspergillus homomorphus CBS 101889]RAL12721.1 ubiquitin-protein ligase [Aspergillus homomorphus CBS 101889]